MMGKFFADIFTISCGKLQNFVGNFLRLCAGSFKISLRTVSQFYFLTKYYMALKLCYKTLKERATDMRIILSLISNKG